MKTLLKLFLSFCLLVTLALVAVYFVLMNPGSKKNLIEGGYPKGSIEHVRQARTPLSCGDSS